MLLLIYTTICALLLEEVMNRSPYPLVRRCIRRFLQQNKSITLSTCKTMYTTIFTATRKEVMNRSPYPLLGRFTATIVKKKERCQKDVNKSMNPICTTFIRRFLRPLEKKYRHNNALNTLSTY